MIETTVESIRVSLVTQNRVVLLREVDGDRHLPIWIGAYEAEAIMLRLQDIPATRPIPYDLMQSMLTELGATVTQIMISDLTDQVYFARIVIEHAGRTFELDSRPSDAIALAVRTGSRIFVAESVMDAAGVITDTDDDDIETAEPSHDLESTTTATTESASSPSGSEEGLNVFRDFINSLDLDDFDRKKSN